MKSGAVVLIALIGLANATDLLKPETRAGSCQFSHHFQSSGNQAYLQSPNYPGSYSKNADCKYSLTSPPRTQINMNCTEFNVEYINGCSGDQITISLSGDSSLKDGTIVCGQGTFERTSQSNALAVGFKSDGSNPKFEGPFRFKCLLTVIGTALVPTTPLPTKPTTSALEFESNCSCGTRNEGIRIVGGSFAEINEFPWRVAMYTPRMGVFCGGTIISSNYVLFAAHCNINFKYGDQLFADVGDHDLSTGAEADNQLIKCRNVIQHRQYNNDTQDNDMALCELERPLTYSRTIQPVCLPWTMTQENFQGKIVTASGWGTTVSGGSASFTINKVDLPVKTTEECRKYYGDDSITDNMFCTYSPGKDTCQGDSGGSIDYKEPNSGRYFAIGVVSWGVGCAGVNQPGVYAKVTRYLDWITKSTGGEQFCR